jgi:hypothetical protein
VPEPDSAKTPEEAPIESVQPEGAELPDLTAIEYEIAAEQSEFTKVVPPCFKLACETEEFAAMLAAGTE